MTATFTDQTPVGYSIVNKVSRNIDIDSGSAPEDVWEGGGNYPGFQAVTAEFITVVSTSSADSGAGIGARSIRIVGLDENYKIVTETLSINGTTKVTSVGKFIRAHTASIVSAGSNQFNVGTLTVAQAVSTANVFLMMLPGVNQTNCGAYTVPAGYNAYLVSVQANIAGNNSSTWADLSLWVRQFGQAPRLRRPSFLSVTRTHLDEPYGGIMLPSKADVIPRIMSVSNNNTQICVSYDIVLVAI
jgi:hypothetical protein